MDISGVILNAKLKGTRKHAQIDACSVFAAALYDVLREYKVPCTLQVASFSISGRVSNPEWYHSVVRVRDKYFDSLGEFSHDIVRNRLKIHPNVKTSIVMKRDPRTGCFEDEFDELHAFYVKTLRVSAMNILRDAEPDEEPAELSVPSFGSP